MRDCALYWVSTAIWRMPELTQFESTKSMMRNLPPNGVAGLQRCSVNPLSRSPRPPAMTTASVPLVNRLTERPVLVRAACRIHPQRATVRRRSHQVFGGADCAFARLHRVVPLKLCILSSEIVPYAKTGGLADVAGALLRELKELGHDVRAFMPLYAPVRRAHSELQPVSGLEEIRISIGSARYAYSVRSARLPGTEIPTFFIDCPEMFHRAAFYTFHAVEHRRFLLFTRAAIESCLYLGCAPDIFHVNDWHTAFLPLFLKTMYSSVPEFEHSRSVLTIHNMGYQGIMPAAAVADLGLGPFAGRLDAADRAAGVINPLKTGIKFADMVTTVS